MICAFSRRVYGHFEIPLAKYMAIHTGLVFALESGLYPQEIESGALNVVRAIQENKPTNAIGTVIEDINFQ